MVMCKRHQDLSTGHDCPWCECAGLSAQLAERDATIDELRRDVDEREAIVDVAADDVIGWRATIAQQAAEIVRLHDSASVLLEIFERDNCPGSDDYLTPVKLAAVISMRAALAPATRPSPPAS